ncbi:MAG: HEAT repeat domain-containing protein [bacterium]|nr:HEAT repeat domain-containing protein [bacterium]
MNIQFCDLCNESVAAKELKAGAAYQRGGRLICAACDASMGGGGFEQGLPEASPGVTTPVPVPAHNPSWAFAGVTLVSLLLAGWALWHAQASGRTTQTLSQRMDVVTGQIDQRWERLNSQQDTRWSSWSQAAAADLDGQGARWQEVMAALKSEVQGANRTALARQNKLRADWAAWKLAAAQAPVDETPWLEDLASLRQRIEEQRLANEEVWVVLADRLQAFENSLQKPSQSPSGDEAAPWFSLTQNLGSPNPGLRLEALFSLEQTRDRRICSYLIPLLADPDPLVRVACARVLKDHRYREAVPQLIAGLEDPVLTVRVGFLDALRTITKRQFGYRADGRESERRRPLKDWQDWWKKMGVLFLAGDPG